MNILKATILKEFLLLIKDRRGVILLFIMPLILVVAMTLIQHEAYKMMQSSGVPILVVNLDQDILGNEIQDGFQKNDLAKVTILHQLPEDAQEKFKEKITSEGYSAGIIIPKNSTVNLKKNVDNIMKLMIEGDTNGLKTEEIHFQIIFNPTSRKSIEVALSNSLQASVSNIRTRVLFQILSDQMANMTNSPKIKVPEEDYLVFNNSYATSEKASGYEPNAVQHNIPAWSIFSIFFIVLPLASSIILEKSEGLFVRIKTLPGNYITYLSGKWIVYMIVAVAQFMMVFALGKYLFPVIGLPELQVISSWWVLIAVTICISFAATSYGLLLGTTFNTAPQTAIFGGVSILLMSAFGGIWMPVNLMPETMQHISKLSPLNWGLHAYYEVFITGGSWSAVATNCYLILTFAALCILISWIVSRIKISKTTG